MRGYALRAAELAGAVAGLATSVILLIAGCALLGVAAAGGGGAVVAIVIAVVLVAAVFACCDRLALSTMLARPVSEVEQPELYRLVRELSKAGRLPVPRLYLSPADQPNSFAVGRGPRTRHHLLHGGPAPGRSTRPSCAACSGMSSRTCPAGTSWPHRCPRAWRLSSRSRPAWPGSPAGVTPLALWRLAPCPGSARPGSARDAADAGARAGRRARYPASGDSGARVPGRRGGRPALRRSGGPGERPAQDRRRDGGAGARPRRAADLGRPSDDRLPVPHRGLCPAVLDAPARRRAGPPAGGAGRRDRR